MMGRRASCHGVRDDMDADDAEAASRLVSSLSAMADSTDPHDERQNRAISGFTTACAGFWSPDGEAPL